MPDASQIFADGARVKNTKTLLNGVYGVMESESVFRGGRFTQNLKCIRQYLCDMNHVKIDSIVGASVEPSQINITQPIMDNINNLGDKVEEGGAFIAGTYKREEEKFLNIPVIKKALGSVPNKQADITPTIANETLDQFGDLGNVPFQPSGDNLKPQSTKKSWLPIFPNPPR